MENPGSDPFNSLSTDTETLIIIVVKSTRHFLCRYTSYNLQLKALEICGLHLVMNGPARRSGSVLQASPKRQSILQNDRDFNFLSRGIRRQETCPLPRLVFVFGSRFYKTTATSIFLASAYGARRLVLCLAVSSSNQQYTYGSMYKLRLCWLKVQKVLKSLNKCLPWQGLEPQSTRIRVRTTLLFEL